MDMNYRGGMWEGGGEQDGVKGRKWDNCNSIINKYIKKSIKIGKFLCSHFNIENERKHATFSAYYALLFQER